MEKRNEIVLFIKDKIQRKAKQFEIEIAEEVNESFSITGSGLFDSMDFMNLIVEVEEKFGVEVDFSEYEPEVFTTIGGFVNCAK